MEPSETPIPGCQGRMFPSLADRRANTSHRGVVFGFVVKSLGLGQSGHKVTVDEAAWNHCLECPRFRPTVPAMTSPWRVSRSKRPLPGKPKPPEGMNHA